ASYPHDLRGYTAKRFSFYLGRLGALADAIDRDEARRDTKDDAHGAQGSAWEMATNSRSALVSKLRTVAGSRREERAALTVAIGRADDEDNLSRSLIALADLADAWLARKDGSSG